MISVVKVDLGVRKCLVCYEEITGRNIHPMCNKKLEPMGPYKISNSENDEEMLDIQYVMKQESFFVSNSKCDSCHAIDGFCPYARPKMRCEEILNEYQGENFTTLTIRPATVCGYSPRLRLDLTVNILTNLAINKGEITVFG